MSRIELKHIDKFYGDNHVLRDINLTIEDGDFMTLLGPSGCGKTTTLRVVSGLEKPQNGIMTIDGEEMINADLAYYAEPSKRGLNLVFQSYALWPHMTVYDNIAFGLKIQKLPKEEVDKRVHDSLKMMRIEEYIDRYPNELSGGQQQRVAIARALATDPKVLLCDEATSALDPKTTRQILELIRDINQKLNITVVIITHQMSVVKEVCSHVAILDDGCVAESGMVGTVFAAPKSEAGRRLVFPGGADAQVYNPQDEKLVRLVFKDSKTTSIPLIARLAAEEGVFCNVISASTQKLSETVYGSMMLGIPSTQYDKAVAFIHNVANVQVEEVDHHVQ